MDQVIAPFTFDDFMEKLHGGPFGFVRFGDFEVATMTGRKCKSCDGQQQTPQAAADLWAVLQDPAPLMVYGLQAFALREKMVPDLLLSAVPWVEADVLHRASRAGELGPFVRWLRGKKVGLVGPGNLTCLDFLVSSGHVEVETDGIYSRTRAERYAWEAGRMCDHGADVVVFSAGLEAKAAMSLAVDNLDSAYLIDCGSLWDVYAGTRSRSYHRSMDVSTIEKNLA